MSKHEASADYSSGRAPTKSDEVQKERAQKEEMPADSPTAATVEKAKVQDISKEFEKGGAKAEEHVIVEENAKIGGLPEIDPEFASFMAEMEAKPTSTANRGPKSRTLPSFLFEGDKKPVTIGSDGDIQEEPKKDDEALLYELYRPKVDIKAIYESAEKECERLTARVFTSAYDVFKLPSYATDEDVKKAFRRLSLLIHPDKCPHPKAADAFHVVTHAMENMDRPENREQFKLIIPEAKARVLREIASENRKRQARGEEPLPTDEESLRPAITKMCERLVQELCDNLSYAEKTVKANMEWERKMEEEKQAEERAEMIFKRKWAETRDNRATDWKEYQEDIRQKRFKPEYFTPVESFREQRNPRDKTAPKKAAGIDDSYKKHWR